VVTGAGPGMWMTRAVQEMWALEAFQRRRCGTLLELEIDTSHRLSKTLRVLSKSMTVDRMEDRLRSSHVIETDPSHSGRDRGRFRSAAAESLSICYTAGGSKTEQ